VCGQIVAAGSSSFLSSIICSGYLVGRGQPYLWLNIFILNIKCDSVFVCYPESYPVLGSAGIFF
jgi:hypothetical protein